MQYAHALKGMNNNNEEISPGENRFFTIVIPKWAMTALVAANPTNKYDAMGRENPMSEAAAPITITAALASANSRHLRSSPDICLA